MWFYLKIVLKSIGKLGILQIFHACKYRWYNKWLSFLSDHWGLGRRRRDKRATVRCPARRDSPAHGLLTIWMIVRKKSYSIDTNYVAIQLTLAKLRTAQHTVAPFTQLYTPAIYFIGGCVFIWILGDWNQTFCVEYVMKTKGKSCFYEQSKNCIYI